MKAIKSYIKKIKSEFVEYEDKTTEYVLSPICIFMKNKQNKNYMMSFDISTSNDEAIQFFANVVNHFDGKIDFKIYEDCIMSIENGLVEYFCFGDEARELYFQYIHDIVESNKEFMNNVTVH